MLTVVAKTSVHSKPSGDTDTANACAGNSQTTFKRSRLRVSPRSIVKATGPVSPGLLAQKVASSASTAAAAACEAELAEDVASAAACEAAFSMPPPSPDKLKHFSPTRACPFASNFHVLAPPQSDMDSVVAPAAALAHLLLTTFINCPPPRSDQSSRPSPAAMPAEHAPKPI